jgi:5-methylthioadenosine/S-adenosylhomocysteine deaminase
MSPNPIDPLEGPKLAVRGRVVCMDATFRVLDDAVVYIEKGAIAAIAPKGAAAPSGFENVEGVPTRGSIFPGLIELHNHLSYNALRLWDVPKQYTNRDTWAGTGEYRQLISGPMQVIGKTPGLLPAVVRYVETKCLFGGVTTSQGIQLFSNAGARRYYRGIVRNVEQTDEADLPEAATKIADVEAADIEKFHQRLLRQSCFLLHLSEGTDKAARQHFLALQKPDGTWAITPALTGIHCAALQPADFGVLGSHGGAMVWSPLSNLLLYGKTADVAAAKTEGVRIGIGSDWSPSGSKNLLGELKVARLASANSGNVFSDREIVAMATTNAASILQWDRVLGSLEIGKRADLIVVAGTSGDAYATLLESKETDIRLVMINGVARYGVSSLMEQFNAGGEKVKVGSSKRLLFLEQKTTDEVVGQLSLSQASETLDEALDNLPALAEKLEHPAPVPAPGKLAARPEQVTWSLALDEIQETGVDLRPRLPFAGHARTGPRRVPMSGPALAAAVTKPLSEIVKPLQLDPLTVADEKEFLLNITNEDNLPPFIASGLKKLYS